MGRFSLVSEFYFRENGRYIIW